MAGTYYRLKRHMPVFKTYGYAKVSASELEEINSRLMKPTASSQVSMTSLYSNERSSQSPHHRETPCCHKYHANDVIKKSRKVDERQLSRIIRRLQTPTLSFEAYMADDYDDESNFTSMVNKMAPRPKSAMELRRTVERLQRPTTATCMKRVGFCFYCDGDEEMKKYKRRPVQPLLGPKIKVEEKIEIPDDFNNDKVLKPHEVDEMTKRVRTPTHASRGGTQACKRQPGATPVTVYENPNLPLTSGLPRTHRIDAIVNRLYRPTYSIPICRHPANCQV